MWVGIPDVVFDFMGKKVGYDWKTGYRTSVVTKGMIYQALIYKHLLDLDAFYFMFLTRGIMVRGDKTDYTIQNIIDKVRHIWETISNGGLEPNLSVCRECPYNLYCKFRTEGVSIYDL